MPSKYSGAVEFDPSGVGDGKVLVWDSATEMFVYADAPTGGGSTSGYVATAPNATGKPVTNLYFDPATGNIVVEYDDAGLAAGTIASNPPQGKHPITNIFFDPASGTLTGEYDDGA